MSTIKKRVADPRSTRRYNACIVIILRVSPLASSARSQKKKTGQSFGTQTSVSVVATAWLRARFRFPRSNLEKRYVRTSSSVISAIQEPKRDDFPLVLRSVLLKRLPMVRVQNSSRLRGNGSAALQRNMCIVFMENTRPRSEERRVGKECRSRWSPY